MAKVTIDGEELSQQDKMDLYIAISGRLGIIETGQHGVRVQDAINIAEPHRIKALSHEQKALVLRMETLMHKLI